MLKRIGYAIIVEFILKNGLRTGAHQKRQVLNNMPSQGGWSNVLKQVQFLDRGNGKMLDVQESNEEFVGKYL